MKRVGFKELGKQVLIQKNSLLTVCSELEKKLMYECFLTDPEIIKVTGMPRNEAFFDSKLKENKNKSWTEILYAPTWREEGNSTSFFPFSDIDFEDLMAFCETHQVRFNMRAHRYDMDSLYQFLASSGVSKERYNKYILLADQKTYPDAQVLLTKIDILITDYSSIYLDYLLLNRPIIFIPYDKEEYAQYRGFLFDYEEHTPGPKTLTYKEFKGSLNDFLSGKDDFLEKRTKLRDTFHLNQEGSYAKNITEEVKKLRIN